MVTELESQLNNKSFSVKSSFKCEICDYSCSSKTVLKRHKSTKHRKETLREENICETSLKMSSVKDERAYELNKSDSFIPSSISVFEEPGQSSPIKVSQIDNNPNPKVAVDIQCDQWPRCIGVSQEVGTS